MPCYPWQPLQPDILTYEIVTSTNRHLKLLGLPREIRNEVYSYVLESEQENQQEYVGKHRNASKSQFCTPLFKIRPPALIRVCRTTRAEYLTLYFHQTCFRIHANVGNPPTPGWDYIAWRLERVSIDKAMDNWLNSLSPLEHAIFRNVQFRLSFNGAPLGASFNLVYNAQAEKYRCEFVMDDGWDGVYEIQRNRRIRGELCKRPEHAWRAFRKTCETRKEEFLDWEFILHLIWRLGSTLSSCKVDSIDEDVLNRVVLRNWSAGAGLDG